MTVGGASVSVSPGTGNTTTLSDLGDDIAAAWLAKYGQSGTASASGNATVTNASGILTISMYDLGAGGYAQDVNLSVAAATGTDSDSTTSAANIDYVIGSTILESDDATVDKDVILTMTSTSAGTILNQTGTVSTVTSANQDVGQTQLTGLRTHMVELTTTKLSNTTDTGAGTYERALMSAGAVNAENGTLEVVTTAAQSKTRVHWL